MEEENERGYKLEYKCSLGYCHRVILQRIKAQNDDAVARDINTKSFKLSLDGSPLILEDFSDEKKMEFALSVVNSKLGTIAGVESDESPGYKVEIENIDENTKSSLDIVYRLIFDDEKQMEQWKEDTVQLMDSSNIEFESMIFPVLSHEELVEMTLSERMMKEEVDGVKREEEAEERKLRVMEIAKKADDILKFNGEGYNALEEESVDEK